LTMEGLQFNRSRIGIRLPLREFASRMMCNSVLRPWSLIYGHPRLSGFLLLTLALEN
jgi:hypothetical protein